jgi:hypothetical protein
MRYSIHVRNGGTAALTGVGVRIQLAVDVLPTSQPATDAAFVSGFVPAGCSLVSSQLVTCSVGNLASGASADFGPLVARTPRVAEALSTRSDVTASANESQQDRPSADPQPDTFTVSEFTTYEQNADLSVSFVFAGGTTLLATSPGDGQSTEFAVPVPNAFAGLLLTSLEEFSPGEAGYFCPAGISCWGQSITSSAPGIFSSSNLAQTVTAADIGIVPGPVNPRSVAAYHRYDNGSVAVITARCSTAFDVLPPASEAPCLNATIDRAAHVMRIRLVDLSNGQWGFD